jgi:hypothetical protein
MYINTQTNQYPVSEAEIKAQFSTTSFPVPFVAPDEYKVVFVSPKPTFNTITESVREITPELTSNGTWEQRWEVYALDAATVAANQAKEEERLQKEVVDNTQKRLDTFAKTRNYDGILSACTYATSTVPKFQAEGQYCVEARDTTWATLYQILAEVQAGTRPVPSGFADIESELPTLVWPV